MHTGGSIHQWIPRENQTVQSLQLQEVATGALTIIACALTIIACAQIIARRAQSDTATARDVSNNHVAWRLRGSTPSYEAR